MVTPESTECQRTTSLPRCRRSRKGASECASKRRARTFGRQPSRRCSINWRGARLRSPGYVLAGRVTAFPLLPVFDCVFGLVDGLIDLLPRLLRGSLFRTRTGRDGNCQQRSDDDEATDDFHAPIMTTSQHSRLSDSGAIADELRALVIPFEMMMILDKHPHDQPTDFSHDLSAVDPGTAARPFRRNELPVPAAVTCRAGRSWRCRARHAGRRVGPRGQPSAIVIGPTARRRRISERQSKFRVTPHR